MSSNLAPTGTFSFPQGITADGPDLFVANQNNNTIGEYTFSGTVVNSSLINLGGGLPDSIVSNGPDLFVAGMTSHAVGEYDTTGHTVNSSFITGIAAGRTILAISGTNLFVANGTTISDYSISGSPMLVTSWSTSGLASTYGLAVSGSDVFAATGSNISEYSITGSTATLVNASLISGGVDSYGLATNGSALFVAGHNSGTIEAYDMNTWGQLAGFTDITGLTGNDHDLVVAVVPETPTCAAIVGGAVLCLTLLRRRSSAIA